jgi:hypothetical protein
MLPEASTEKILIEECVEKPKVFFLFFSDENSRKNYYQINYGPTYYWKGAEVL